MTAFSNIDYRMPTCVTVGTETILEARDEVLGSNQEVAFNIDGSVNRGIPEISKITKAQLESTSANSIDYSPEEYRKSGEYMARAHSHLQEHGHQHELSTHDKEELQRGLEYFQQQFHLLFYKKSNGVVAYKAFNALGKRIDVDVKSHVTGEVRTSGENSGGSAQWEKNFWGIENQSSANTSDYRPNQEAAA